SDLAAKNFDVEIVRIPVRHCVLNPIELAWAQLKNYVRENNTRFHLTDVHNFILEYMSAVGPELCESYYRHVKKAEESFKTADNFIEQIIDPDLEDESDCESDDDDCDDLSGVFD
ncbi:unnamed protein product, partial [Didymodactylos carnosus]